MPPGAVVPTSSPQGDRRLYAAPVTSSAQTVDRLERWFLKRGIPHFISRYSASRDVMTRALPLLTLVFLAEMLAAGRLGWPWWANRIAELGGLAVLVGVWAAVNRSRGRRPLSRPESVGAVELSVFVAVPALLPIIFGGDFVDAAWIIAANAGLLGVVYVTTSYGLVPMTRWAVVRLFVQLGDTFRLFTRGLPLLLVAFTFLFINAEVWQVAGTIEVDHLVGVLALFAILGGVFIVSRLPREIGPLATFEQPGDLEALVSDTPASGLPIPDPVQVPAPTRRQWGNAGLVALFTQGLRVVFAAALIGGFFIVFGLLTMSPETIASWTGAPATTVGAANVAGFELVLTDELLRVASFLAGFAGLYFAVYLATDPTLREEFFEDIRAELREAFAVRVVYLGLTRNEHQRS